MLTQVATEGTPHATGRVFALAIVVVCDRVRYRRICPGNWTYPTTAGTWTNAPSFGSGVTTLACTDARFETFMEGWLIAPDAACSTHGFAYLEILEVTGANSLTVKGDLTGMLTGDERFWIFAPPGVDAQTGAIRGTYTGATFKPAKCDSRYLWAQYRYMPPMAGYETNPGTPGIYGKQPGTNQAGTYHAWNRQYDPSTGRWTTPDPAASPWGNLWDYAKSQPLESADPSGLTPKYVGFPHGEESLGYRHAFSAELECGVFLFWYKLVMSEPTVIEGRKERFYHSGVTFTIGFWPNGRCCCDSLQMVQFVREREFDVSSSRVSTPRVGSSPYQSSDGWQVDTQNASRPELPKRTGTAVPGGRVSARRLERDGRESGIALEEDKSGSQYHDNYVQDKGKHTYLHFDFTNCVYCDNGRLMGCFSFSYFVIPGNRVTFLKNSVSATDDADFMNSHPARNAWNNGSSSAPIPKVHDGDK